MCCAGCRWSAPAPQGDDPAGEFPRPEFPCRSVKLREKLVSACEYGIIIPYKINVLPIRSGAALTLWQGKIDALRDAGRETGAGRGRCENEVHWREYQLCN